MLKLPDRDFRDVIIKLLQVIINSPETNEKQSKTNKIQKAPAKKVKIHIFKKNQIEIIRLKSIITKITTHWKGTIIR